MYFSRSCKILLRSIQIVFKRPVILGSALLLALFGASYQSFEFFRLHVLSEIVSLSLNIKVLYLTWEVFSWFMSVLLGSLIFPALIVFIATLEEKHEILSFKKLYKTGKELSYKFIMLLFVYYNLLFLIAGGGFLIAVISLFNNIYYAKDTITLFDTSGNLPLITSFVTIGVIASTCISLLFSVISQILILEKKGLIESIISGLRMLNEEFPTILSAWIILNLATLIPIIVISVILNGLSALAANAPSLAPYGFYLGAGVFFMLYTPLLGVYMVYWTETYLTIKGKINPDMLVDLPK